MKQNSSNALPRYLYPVDFTGLAGPVMATIPISAQLFLVLVDDNRGTSGAHPGAFQAQWITLTNGRFGILHHSHSEHGDITNKLLPRMSCAVYHPFAGVIYAAGRKLGQVAVPEISASPNTTGSSSSRLLFKGAGRVATRGHATAARWKFRYDHVTLPKPGVRSGSDAMAVNTDGSVAVAAVGNVFFAVAGIQEPLDDHGGAMDQDPNNAVGVLSAATGGDTSIINDNNVAGSGITNLISFQQASQVHPIMCLDLEDPSVSDQDWSSWFLASSRMCAVVDFYNASPPRLSRCSARGDSVTLASPILAAASNWPWLIVLTSDGLLSIRSPSCLAIALRTIEIGTLPNDFFSLRTHSPVAQKDAAQQSWLVAISYSGHAKVLHCNPDSAQDLADRFMRLAIDALGADGFPRAALAKAIRASFGATSYVGPQPTKHSKHLFLKYCEAILGLMELDSGAVTSWPTQISKGDYGKSSGGNSNRSGGGAAHHGALGGAQTSQHHMLNRSQWQDRLPAVVSAATPATLLTSTAMLCLVCATLQPVQASLANRSAKACVNQLGMVVSPRQLSCDGAVQVCESVAETLLQETTSTQSAEGEFSRISGSSREPIVSSNKVKMEFVEAAVWLLRSCGRHDRAMQVLQERMQMQQQLQQSSKLSKFGVSLEGWSQIKFDSYTATHLSELWGSNCDEGCQLVLQSPATRRLLENNPALGLSAFTALHPQNTAQWKALNTKDDPLAHPTYPRQVLQLLQSIQPVASYNSSPKAGYHTFSAEQCDLPCKSTSEEDLDDSNTANIPLTSGRALSVAFLESAVGIATGRPSERDEFDSLPMEDGFEERMVDFHDELAFLLLEGVIAERRDFHPQNDERYAKLELDDDDDETTLGRKYRKKLRRLLRWPLCKVRPDRFLAALPASFLQERAFTLGNLGRHEEALTIFYRELKSLDLALEYCDFRHRQIQDAKEREKAHKRKQQQRGGFLEISEQEQCYYSSYNDNTLSSNSDCAFVPLVRVALETCEEIEEGTKAAIQVLALRRSVMNWGAALRLLPKHVAVSAVARPFLIPALVESESQVRRLVTVAALLRARYASLKHQLTTAQLKVQENFNIVPQLKSLNLGEPLHSTKPVRAKPSASASPTFPDVMIIKHFFSRHLVIQAKVKHALEGRSMGDVNFVVAESSEEAVQPSLQVPLKVLPANVQGSTWCVLSASPQRMDNLAILTCELRYTIFDADGFTAVDTLSAGGVKSYIEELRDLEVLATNFQ